MEETEDVFKTLLLYRLESENKLKSSPRQPQLGILMASIKLEVSITLYRSPVVAISAFAVVVGLVLGYAVRVMTAPVVTRVVAPAPLTSPAAAPPATADQYPLTIPAQRARLYPGGHLRPEQDLGEQSSFRLSRVSYPSDGYRVYGLMAIPRGPRPVFGWPVVIVVHGYVAPDAYRTEGPEYLAYIQALANHGYAVIKPDLRGHGQSWGVARGAYFSPDYNADILNLAASLHDHPALNAQSVGLFGYSMGGNVVLDALAIAPQRFKSAVIASGAVGDVSDMYYHWRPTSEAGAPAALPERQRVARLFGGPEDNPSFWRSVSPLSYAGSVTTPVQLHHGLSDTVVPPRFSDQLAAALIAAGRPPEVYFYPGVSHVYSGTAQVDLIERSLRLFERTLHR